MAPCRGSSVQTCTCHAYTMHTPCIYLHGAAARRLREGCVLVGIEAVELGPDEGREALLDPCRDHLLHALLLVVEGRLEQLRLHGGARGIVRACKKGI